MKKVLDFHIKKLRLYVDGIVWRTLHAHTIRELASNHGVPHSILGQGEAFDLVLKTAWDLLEEYNVPIFIADISNILRAGDLIVCVDQETPLIVECKLHLPSPKYLLQGRIGRQISRNKSSVQYLRKGRTKVFGKPSFKQVVESPHRARRNWDTISAISLEAQKQGRAIRELSQNEMFCAYKPTEVDGVLTELAALNKMNTQAQFGSSLGLMNMVDGLFAPPSAWLIDQESRFLVLEEEIVIAHLVGVDAFEFMNDSEREIRVSLSDDPPIIVRIKDREFKFTGRFFYDVLYGFESVSSCVDGLLDFAERIYDIKSFDVPDLPTAKPVLYHAETIGEVHEILLTDDISPNSIVSMPLELFKILEPRGLQHAPQVIIEATQSGHKLAILDVAQLKDLDTKLQ